MRAPVVPRKGDVDRNNSEVKVFQAVHVVPRKGDVDRNCIPSTRGQSNTQSSPARGTWIEIDHNTVVNKLDGSSPARGTWIEMTSGNKLRHRPRPSSPARGTWIEIPLSTDFLRV